MVFSSALINENFLFNGQERHSARWWFSSAVRVCLCQGERERTMGGGAKMRGQMWLKHCHSGLCAHQAEGDDDDDV